MAPRRKNSRDRYGSRPPANRQTLPIVTIVCDDTKTAVAYFNELKREVKSKVTVNVERAPRDGAIPAELLKKAREIAGGIESSEEDDRNDSIWVLVDTEAEEYKQNQARQVKQQAEQGQSNPSIQVLLSQPCYEVWTLSHFIATGRSFNNCRAVLDQLKQEWLKKFSREFPSEKSQADYSKLTPLRSIAVENAKKRNPECDPSWTEVYQAVEAILKLLAD